LPSFAQRITLADPNRHDAEAAPPAPAPAREAPTALSDAPPSNPLPGAAPAATDAAASSGGPRRSAQPLLATRDAVLAASGAQDAVEVAPGQWFVRGPCWEASVREALRKGHPPGAPLFFTPRSSDVSSLLSYLLCVHRASVHRAYAHAMVALLWPGVTELRYVRPLREGDFVRSVSVNVWKVVTDQADAIWASCSGGAPYIAACQDPSAPFPPPHKAPLAHVYVRWPPPSAPLVLDAAAAIEAALSAPDLTLPYIAPAMALPELLMPAVFVEQHTVLPPLAGAGDAVVVDGERYVRVKSVLSPRVDRAALDPDDKSPLFQLQQPDGEVPVTIVPDAQWNTSKRSHCNRATALVAADLLSTPLPHLPPSAHAPCAAPRTLTLAQTPVSLQSLDWMCHPAFQRYVDPAAPIATRTRITMLTEYARALGRRLLIAVPPSALALTPKRLWPPKVRRMLRC
jgi:hypothetical protein